MGSMLKPLSFREELVKGCKDQLYHDLKCLKSLTSISLDKEEYIKKNDTKHNILGNIRLIAELYNKKILPAKDLFQIISDLFEMDTSETSQEIFLELLCELFTYVGSYISNYC